MNKQHLLFFQGSDICLIINFLLVLNRVELKLERECIVLECLGEFLGEFCCRWKVKTTTLTLIEETIWLCGEKNVRRLFGEGGLGKNKMKTRERKTGRSDFLHCKPSSTVTFTPSQPSIPVNEGEPFNKFCFSFAICIRDHSQDILPFFHCILN